MFAIVAGIVLFVAWRLDNDARRFEREAIKADVIAARVVPAVSPASTVYELTYRMGPASGSQWDQSDAVPVAIWEAAIASNTVAVKRLANGEVKVWNPSSGSTVAIVAAVGAVFLLFAGAIALVPASLGDVVARVPFWTLFGSIWLTVGLPFLVLSLAFLWQDWRLSTSGATAQGIVLVKEASRSGKTPSGPTFRHSVYYRFTEANGRVLEGKSEVPEAMWDGLVERQPVPIEYVPGSWSHRVAGTHERWLLAIFGCVGLVIGGAGALIIRADWRQRRRVRRLQESGVRALARVTSVQPRNVRVNGEQLWKIKYEYQDRQHRRHSGSTSVTAEEAERWKAGDTAAILIDPAAPKSTVWIGLEPALHNPKGPTTVSA